MPHLLGLQRGSRANQGPIHQAQFSWLRTSVADIGARKPEQLLAALAVLRHYQRRGSGPSVMKTPWPTTGPEDQAEIVGLPRNPTSQPRTPCHPENVVECPLLLTWTCPYKSFSTPRSPYGLSPLCPLPLQDPWRETKLPPPETQATARGFQGCAR